MADAEQTLREILDKLLDELNYKPRETNIKAITSGGANYTSFLFLVSVSSPDREDLKLFAKVACIGDVMRTRMSADWLYKTEKFVYTNLVKKYKDLEDELRVPDEHRFKYPKVYSITEEIGKETVVMENLLESGYKSYNRFISMDWEHAAAGVENLAKFHALSFAYAAHYPEEFEKLAVDLKFRLGTEEPDEESKQIWVNMTEGSLQILKEEHRDPVRQIVFNPENTWGTFNKPIGKPVIVHGDYRLSNLLFRKQDDTVQAISVDYQTVYAGTPVCDLAYFITLGSDQKFREKYFHKLLDFYYTKLEEALRRLSVDPSEAYPREKFDSDFKEMYQYVLILAVTMLPIVTVEAESAPRVDGDADMTSFIMKPNELFAQRFSELVSDCLDGNMFKRDT